MKDLADQFDRFLSLAARRGMAPSLIEKGGDVCRAVFLTQMSGVCAAINPDTGWASARIVYVRPKLADIDRQFDGPRAMEEAMQFLARLPRLNTWTGVAA